MEKTILQDLHDVSEEQRRERKRFWYKMCQEMVKWEHDKHYVHPFGNMYHEFEQLIKSHGLKVDFVYKDLPHRHTIPHSGAQLYDYILSNGEIYCWDEPL